MFSRFYRKAVCTALSVLLVANSALAIPSEHPVKPDSESYKAILDAVARSATETANPFEFVCPSPGISSNRTTIIGLPEEPPNIAYTFFSTFLPILAGKSVELLQGDICQMLASGFFESDADVYEFCDNPDNLLLSKAAAKSLGKIAKGFQAGKSGFALASFGVTGYGSVKLSQGLSSISVLQGLTLTTLTLAADQFSRPEGLRNLIGISADNDYYIAFDHWVGRPFIYRTASTGCRYALEKAIQKRFLDKAVQDQIASWILSHSPVSARSAEILAKGTSIGTSKVGTGILAASVVSVSEIALDALSEEPEYESWKTRLEKYFKDVGVAAGTNFLIAVALPTTIVAGKVRRIVLAVLIGNILHWVAFTAH